MKNRYVVAGAALALPAMVAANLTPIPWWVKPVARVTGSMLRIPSSEAIALTFDDGPDVALDHFLRMLQEYDANATFFVTGEQVDRAPGRLAEIVAAGHEVGVHGYHHRKYLYRTPWDLRDDLRRARSVIESASGRRTEYFRPPFGIFNLATWYEVRRQGWDMVLWSRWGKDWEPAATRASIVNEIGAVEPGDIVLLHDSDRYSAPNSWRNTLSALPILFERLSRNGLTARSIGRMVQESTPKRLSLDTLDDVAQLESRQARPALVGTGAVDFSHLPGGGSTSSE